MSPPPPSPFDVVVVTSPDERAAAAARDLVASLLDGDGDGRRGRASPLLLSSCDPHGARLGSGGGTLAALAEADAAYRRVQRGGRDEGEAAAAAPAGEEATVLICHAGGASSRAPTQAALGKAWTSLPVVRRAAHDAAPRAAVSNPTALLVAGLSRLLASVPRGSVVVAASDVLLSFGDADEEDGAAPLDFAAVAREGGDEGGGAAVVGVAVPAPLAVARNHGVFVVPPAAGNGDGAGRGWRIALTHRALQKPSAAEMAGMKEPACAFRRPGDGDDAGGLHAWIDTGVVAFLPRAAGTLRRLSRTALRCCTRDGLTALHAEERERGGGRVEEKGSAEGLPSSSLARFAQGTAPAICLYADLLAALRTTSSSAAAATETGPRGALRRALADHALYTCVIPRGSFVHLGTTAELLDFLGVGAAAEEDRGGSGARDAGGQVPSPRDFGRALGLTRRASAFVAGFQREWARDAVVLNSVLASGSPVESALGAGSVIEHCHLACARIQLGERCLLSGVRGRVKGSTLCLPRGTCLQLLPLRPPKEATNPSSEGAGSATASFVCLCFGVDDGIKAAPPQTLFGVAWHDVLRRSGMAEEDLWEAAVPSSRRALWNARVHPVLTPDDRGELDLSFLHWVRDLTSSANGAITPLPPDAKAGLARWREAPRLSFSEIRARADSAVEVRYRNSIPVKRSEDERLEEMSAILADRRHEPCNFDYVCDSSSCSRALGALDGVASRAAARGRHDVVGRAFMTMSALLSRADNGRTRRGERPARDDDDGCDAERAMTELIVKLRAPQIPEGALTSLAALRDLLLQRDDSFHPDEVLRCRDFLERSAAAMTARCVSGRAVARAPRSPPLPTGAAAVASAPARIDLCGGWSDTPPISYEHGGAVACLAVLVDGKRPLRARCRMVAGGRGVTLRIEARSLGDEALIDATAVTIELVKDLSDYGDPSAECALLKCALIQLGLVPLDSIANGNSSPIQPLLNAFCQTEEDVGLEVTSTSLLPTGSGMGSSSILAGCVLSAVSTCVGIKLTGTEGTCTRVADNNDNLIHAVLMTEQLLTTGGGWQDNIGGLVGGLKLGTSDAGILPLQTNVQRIDVPPAMIDKLNQRLVLTFSGQPRLAKNILQNVLRRWATRSGNLVDTVRNLVDGATTAIACVKAGDVDGLGRVMSRYWQCKKAMAGADSGVEPASVRTMLALLAAQDAIAGGTLCGAGGGGFLAMIAAEGKTARDIETIVDDAVVGGTEAELGAFSWHSCTVSKEGLVVDVIEA